MKVVTMAPRLRQAIKETYMIINERERNKQYKVFQLVWSRNSQLCKHCHMLITFSNISTQLESNEFIIQTYVSVSWRLRTYPTYNIPTIANKTTRRTSNASWAPVPTTAERITKLRGGRKTSPCTSFQPDSSLTSLSCKHGRNDQIFNN